MFLPNNSEISKSFGYLIRITIHSFDQSFLDKEIFLIFFFAMNIIDWIAFFLALMIQVLLFSRGHNFNKSFLDWTKIHVKRLMYEKLKNTYLY